ncbi:MAG TPA: hypothetical protein VM282_10530 [Acidimicrobiales bacterium]|nr:hypothetical protein [Acidimicrobiales bacterium]
MGRGTQVDRALVGDESRTRAAIRPGVTYRTTSTMDEIERMPGASGTPTPLAATDVRVERTDARLGPVLTTVQHSTVPLATNGEFPPWPTMFFPLGTSEIGFICGHPIDTHLAYAAGPRAERVLSGPGGIPHALVGYEPGAVEETARASSCSSQLTRPRR